MRKKTEHISKIIALLKREYPAHDTLLQYSNAYELLMAVILSAQCADEQVNRVLPSLFSQYPDLTTLAKAAQHDVEQLVRSTGFYKNKASNLIACAKKLLSNFSGNVPNTMEELTTLPGVGRKTAGVVLHHIFGKPAIIVDTHFGRVCRRLGLSNQKDPEKLELAVGSQIPEAQWGLVSMVVNFHGRRVCKSRAPDCEHCAIAALCKNKGRAATIK